MNFYIASLYLIVFVISLFGTWLIKEIAIRNKFLDIPNERSSHIEAIPSGAGVVIVIISLLAMLALYFFELISLKSFIPLFIALALLSLVGWIDDRISLSIGIRLAAQIFVALCSMYFIGGIYEINIIKFHLDISIISYLVGIIWVVGFINMYNFMDGIDGFIGSHTVISGLFVGAWFYFFKEPGLALLSIIISASSLGFLYWNFAPAKIFCGDVGSTALGGVFAILGLYLHNENGMSIIFYSGLFLFFIIDSSFTLLKRLLKGEKFWLPHKEHLYQKLAVRFKSHSIVSSGVTLLSSVIGSLCSYYMWLFYIN